MISIIFLAIQIKIILKRKKLLKRITNLKKDESINKDKIKEIQLELNELEEKYYSK
ncbi:UNVERIFIED_CONTAM: hypothetical protein O8I53_11525 [Campylobacter lari]